MITTISNMIAHLSELRAENPEIAEAPCVLTLSHAGRGELKLTIAAGDVLTFTLKEKYEDEPDPTS